KILFLYFKRFVAFAVLGKVCITSNLDLVFFMFTPNDDNSFTTLCNLSLLLFISSLLTMYLIFNLTLFIFMLLQYFIIFLKYLFILPYFCIIKKLKNHRSY